MIDWKTDIAYAGQRYGALRFIEESGGEPSLQPYLDDKGIPTIGVGMNLQTEASRDAVLSELGFDPQEEIAEGETLSERIGDIVSPNYSYSNPEEKAAQEARLQRRLDEVLVSADGDRDTFAFTDDSEVRATFDNLAQRYEATINDWAESKDAIDEWTGEVAIPQSGERLALFSLAWQGLIGFNRLLKNGPVVAPFAG